MELNIKEKIQDMYSFKQRSNDAFLRWKTDICIEEAMEVVKKIGRMCVYGFTIDEENEFVYRNLVKWVNGDETMQAIDPNTKNIIQGDRKAGIYLAGSTGSGKTLCMEIIKAYASVVGAKIQIYPDEPKLLTWTSIHASHISVAYANTGEVFDMAGRDVLFIEDLGCEPESSTYMGNKTDVLGHLLEYRGDYTNKLTLITTNLPMMADATKQRYGNRVVSRLNKLNYFELKGKDRRY